MKDLPAMIYRRKPGESVMLGDDREVVLIWCDRHSAAIELRHVLPHERSSWIGSCSVKLSVGGEARWEVTGRGESVTVLLFRSDTGSASLVIGADRRLPVHRREVYDAVQRAENR
jgi:sRNA-binding carbon storage regulator CsrA